MSTIHLLILAIHLLATVAKLLRPGGVRAVVAESVLLKHQLVISSRARRRAPNLNSFDRFVLGLGSLFVPAGPVPKLAVMLKPQDLVEIPRGAQETQIPVAFLVGGSSAPRPKRAIAGTHRRDRRVQAPQSPDRLSPHRPGDRADLWRRYRQRHRPPRAREALSTRNRKRWPVLAELYRDLKDSLWSVDLFRCESILLRSHWVMVVMDVFTRRIIGFGVERADLFGASLCRMFNRIIAGKPRPQHLSSDHDPLFRFHRWLANLRILEVEEIKSIPYVPVSHPFVERLIGTIRREFLDHVLIWNAIDLERKLEEFRNYYNEHRVHQSLNGRTPGERSGQRPPAHAVLDHYAWRHHCRGLFQMPIAA